MKLKAFHEIILKDVILLDATKSANTLKKYWFVPLFLCKKELEQLAKQIFDAIGGQTVDNLREDFDKLMSYRRLQVLEVLYKAVQIEIGLKPQILAWKIILERDFKESPQLQEVLSEVKRITDIDIKTPEDVETLQKYIQWKIDKHAELYPAKEEPTGEGVSIVEVLNSVFLCLDLQPNEDMLLVTWIGLKDAAEKRVKQQSKNQDNGERE